MMNINLLPWRETNRKKIKKHFKLNLFVALSVMSGIIFLINNHYLKLIHSQLFNNQTIEQETNHLNDTIKDLSVVKKSNNRLKKLIRYYKKKNDARLINIKFLEKLPELMPENIMIQVIEYHLNAINLIGFSDSLHDISQLSNQIKHSQWVKSIDLIEIESNKNFKIKFSLIDSI